MVEWHGRALRSGSPLPHPGQQCSSASVGRAAYPKPLRGGATINSVADRVQWRVSYRVVKNSPTDMGSLGGFLRDNDTIFTVGPARADGDAKVTLVPGGNPQDAIVN